MFLNASRRTLRRLTQAVADFRRDRSGNIALLFAMLLLPILTAVGSALDYSRYQKETAKAQAALDSALLAGTIAGKQVLDNGGSQGTAIAAANAAASSFYTSNTANISPTTLSSTFTVNGVTISGSGTVSGSTPTQFMKAFGTPSLTIARNAQASAQAQTYMDVYLLIDISASMLLPSTQAGITQMINGTGCALACHWDAGSNDTYGYATRNNIKLRYQVVNTGIQNLLTYLNGNSVYRSQVRVGLWAFDNLLLPMTPITSNFSLVGSNFPQPAIAYTDESAATDFDNLIGSFTTMVGRGGDGSTRATAQKLVILATDGVNDPTRAWTWNLPLRPSVKAFNNGFCSTLRQNNVTLAVINTPYFPMPWDWGYAATLGQPGTSGGPTRVDDVPIVLQGCAGKNYTLGSDEATIQSAFVKLFQQTSAIKLTN